MLEAPLSKTSLQKTALRNLTSFIQESFWFMSYWITQSKSLGFQGDLGHLECRTTHPLLQGVKWNANQHNRFKALSSTSRSSSPGSICLLPALVSDLSPFLTPVSGAGKVPAMWSRGSKGSDTTTLLFIECDVGTQQKAASTAKVAHVCSWVVVKSISALEGQDFVTHLVIHTAIPVLQTLKCLWSLNWLKDYWVYF